MTRLCSKVVRLALAGMSTYEAMMIEREVARGKCQKEREPRNMLCIGELHTVTGKRWTWDIAIICVLLCREK